MMRTTLIVTVAALMLASATAARAQTPPTKPAPPDVPLQGFADVGVRAGDTDGDEARYERYRDLRPGASTLFTWNKNTERYRFGATASNIGYRDQRYTGDFYNDKVTFSGIFDSIPLNYLYDAPLWAISDGRGRFTLDAATRQGVQGPSNVNNDGIYVGVPCAPGGPPATCNASTSAAAKANRSVWNNFISPDDMQVRRDILGGTIKYNRSESFTIDLDASTTSRTGEMPWTASYAFNNPNQYPVPIDQRNNQLKGHVPPRLLGQLLLQRHPDADMGQPNPRHGFQQRPGPTRRPVRPERLQQRQRTGVRAGGALAQQLVELGGRHRYVAPRPADDDQRQFELHVHAPERGAAAVDLQHLDQQRPRARGVPEPADAAA
jgi:hypothetical protein